MKMKERAAQVIYPLQTAEADVLKHEGRTLQSVACKHARLWPYCMPRSN